MTTQNLTPDVWLAAELADKKSKNARYSLRTMAKKLNISPGRLSEFLCGKRPITEKQAIKISERLGYSPTKKDQFLALIKKTSSEKPKMNSRVPTVAPYRQVSSDAFHFIAEPHHISILTLMDTNSFRPSFEWVAEKLGITKTQVKLAVDRLERVGLLKIQDSHWIKIDKNLETTTDISSDALRASHKESLRQAMEALDDIALEFRDITSITMAIDPKKIPGAKKMIRNFRRRLSAYLESGNQTEVYNLNVQLVPLSKIEIKNGGKNEKKNN